MTILTKPFTGSLAKKPETEAEDDKQLIKVEVEVEPEDLTFLQARTRRIGRMTNCCLVLSLTIMTVLGIIAGLHVYRVFLIRKNYAGMCRVPLRELFPENAMIGANLRAREEEPQITMFGQDLPFIKENFMKPQRLEISSTARDFEFDFDIDAENEEYELLELPEIFLGRYMHDFRANYTVIIDTLGSNCFLLALDRGLVPPPSSMLDMIHKIKHGIYDIDFRYIKKNYRIINSVVDDLSTYGHFIPRACGNKHTYRLEELVGDVVVKREATPDTPAKYGEFTGGTLIHYNILNLADI